MTKREALQSILPFEVSELFIDKSLMDSDLIGNSIYSADDKQSIDLCLAEMIRIKVAEPNFSEGDLSIQPDRGALLQLRADILNKYELGEGGISDKSELW